MEKMNAQFNKVSGTVYQGNNQITLEGAKAEGKFESNAWVTFLQARSLNRRIKKGSKGQHVFKGYREIETKDEKGKVKVESVPQGWAVVFNLDQTEEIK